MHTPVSFVIPVLNEQAVIGDLLRGLRKDYPDCELIVVDGGSADQTVTEAMPFCDQLLVGAPGRALQMNLGGRVANTPYVFFLHADSHPQIERRLLDECLARAPKWGFCRVRLEGSNWLYRVIEWFMNHRSRLTRVATGDQMLFIARSLFEQVGGFTDIPLMEDVALCKCLRRICAPQILPGRVRTSVRRWERDGVLQTIVRMWLLRLAYAVGVSPLKLWQFYYGR